eukprot:8089169-Pyramimonas_sp.AAC.1
MWMMHCTPAGTPGANRTPSVKGCVGEVVLQRTPNITIQERRRRPTTHMSGTREHHVFNSKNGETTCVDCEGTCLQIEACVDMF